MTPPKKSFCFAAKFNTPAHSFESPHGAPPIPHGGEAPPHKMAHDATAVFLPYMYRFKELYSQGGGQVTTMEFNNQAKPAERYSAISHALTCAPSGLDAVAYFGHGFPHGMASAHIYDANIDAFARLLESKCNPGVKIILYACSCGRRGEINGCFAAKLANRLSGLGAQVFGHDVAGHAATSYTVFRYPGGVQVAPPGTYGGNGAFKRALKKHGSTLWARFPFMTAAELAAEVRA